MIKYYSFRFNCKDKEDGTFYSVQDHRMTIKEAKHTYEGFLINGYEVTAYVYFPIREKTSTKPRKYEWKKIKNF